MADDDQDDLPRENIIDEQEEDDEGNGDDDDDDEGDPIDAGNRVLDDSSEEDDDDEDEEERLKVAEGFIVDEVEDEQEETVQTEPRRRNRKRRRDRESEELLDEEDLELIGQGGKPPEPQFKRLKRRPAEEPDRGRGYGLEEIFSDEEDGAVDDRPYNRPGQRPMMDEFDDFIEADYPSEEDEGGEELDPGVARPGRRNPTGFDTTGLDEDALEDLTRIFGNGDDYDWALELEALAEDKRRDQCDLQLQDVFEPSQLAERMLTEEDNEIRAKDEPERFQLARKGLSNEPMSDEMLQEEARWIVGRLWHKKKIGQQLPAHLRQNLRQAFALSVRRVLELITVNLVEVPYIFQHKRDFLVYRYGESNGDFTGTEKLLDQSDLWKIVDLDINFRGLVEKRNTLRESYRSIESLISEPDTLVEIMLADADSMEELQDVQDYLNFRYPAELRDIALAQGSKHTKRPGTRVNQWTKIRSSKASKLLVAFGLSPSQVGSNVLGGGERFTPVDDDKPTPRDLADDLCDAVFETGEAVLGAARQIFVEELATSPSMRKFVRRGYLTSAVISCRRTDKGLRKIDEAHPYYEIKYISNMSISAIRHKPELLLKMIRAEEEGLVEVKLQLPDAQDRLQHIVERFRSEGKSEVADAWNEERRKVAEMAFTKLQNIASKSVKELLRTECQESVLFSCREAYALRLDQAPYNPRGMALGSTPRVLAFSNGMGATMRDPVHWASVHDDGRLVDHGTFTNLGRDEAQREKFAALVRDMAPDVIAVSGFTAQAHRLVLDLRGLVADKGLMCSKYKDPETGYERADLLDVTVVNDEVARLYKDSPSAISDLPTVTSMTRYCYALGRYLQDPLKQYALLGPNVVAVTFHPCQTLLPQDKLLRYLESAMVDMVNLVGVDINLVVKDPCTANLLPYVAGLGPRKAMHIIKLINASGGRLTSRGDLVGDLDYDKVPMVGPIIFANCASFLYIEYDATDHTSDPLDNTRVHPEDYDLARKMAADALDMYAEDVRMETDENGPAAIVRLLFRNGDQEKINDLILEEYAEQLEQNSELKHSTLCTIRDELLQPYEEFRHPIRPLDESQIFQMFTGEPEQSLHEQSIVPAVVRLVKDDFAIVKLDCGVEGKINAGDVVYRHSIKDALQPSQTVRGVIIKLNRKDFTFDMSLREEVLRRAERAQHQLSGGVDRSGCVTWDSKLEDEDREALRDKDKTTGRTQRVIKHPLFKLFDKTQAEEFLGQAQNGEAVIRPSSRGNDHITITWKVHNGVFQHLDILELEKDHEFAVGRKLKVGSQIYSDLDELIVDHVRAMSRKVDEMMRHDKWHDKSKSEVANPNRSNYRFCIDPKHAGYFFLLFKANKNAAVVAWMVKVIPQGYEMLNNKYPDMRALCNGFKLVFQNEVAKKQAAAAAATAQAMKGASVVEVAMRNSTC